jgi:tRNA A37 N6-isopentenylltransferase MiaA
LIRALEIVITTGRPVPQFSPIPEILNASERLSGIQPKLSSGSRISPDSTGMEKYNAIWIGITQPQDVLYRRIEKRLKQRIKAGMLKEIERLHHQGLSWKRLDDFGLEYRFGALFLQNKITKQEMLDQMLKANKHYAKRQMTWWKRNKDINWITSETQAKKLLVKFLNQN